MGKYYPIFIDLQGQRCVVVGGGEVAARKVQSLLESGASVCLVSPRLDPSLQQLCDAGEISLVRREYREGDLKGAFLVVAATDDNALNAALSREAMAAGTLVNVVDDPGKSNFIVPSSLRRGDITIAISTGGKSPALAKKMRLLLEETLPQELGGVADLLSEIRHELKQDGISVDAARWQDALELEALGSLVRQGNTAKARELVISRLRPGQAPITEKEG